MYVHYRQIIRTDAYRTGIYRLQVLIIIIVLVRACCNIVIQFYIVCARYSSTQRWYTFVPLSLASF